MENKLYDLNIKLQKVKRLRKEIDEVFTIDKIKDTAYLEMIQRIEKRIRHFKNGVETGKVYSDNSCYKQVLNGIAREKNTINLLEHILLSHQEFDKIEFYQKV